MTKASSDKSRVKRIPKRGYYDAETIYMILDQTSVCNVSFIYEDYPVIIPTIYGRADDTLYFHGATTSRMLKALVAQEQICVAVTFVDGIILARSLFHSSMNYRSVVLFGKAEMVSEEDKMEALKIVSDQIIPGRWEDARLPNPKELKATTVISLKINEASAKIRTGPPGDDKEDYDLDFWAGELPLSINYAKPINDPLLKDGIETPSYVNQFIERNNTQD
jgi:nitroimidazol reductase NimA-like FMN-containing flavoprotein (pyridoxamine 5'-phosphate oxidase superfamily)